MADGADRRHVEHAPRPRPPPRMKLRPFHSPDSRVTGARLAAALASMRPSSGISESRPAAVTWAMPGIEVSTRAFRDISSSVAISFATSAS